MALTIKLGLILITRQTTTRVYKLYGILSDYTLLTILCTDDGYRMSQKEEERAASRSLSRRTQSLPFIYLFIDVLIYLFIHLSVYLFIHLFFLTDLCMAD